MPAHSAPDARPTARLSTRQLASGVLIALALVGAAYALYKNRTHLADAWRSVGVGSFVLSLVFGLLSVLCNAASWRSVLGGLDVHLRPAEAARVFCVSQLGKYLPGSVWPVVTQMAAGRRHGGSKRTMLTANLLTLLVSLSAGLTLACALLPSGDHPLFRRYWFLLLAIPPLLAMLHPRAFTAVLDRLFSLAKRPPLNERLPVPATIRAAGWAVGGWIFLGLHLYLLCAALGTPGLRTFVLCTGSIAAAVCIGILAIPVPAGAGIREAVLGITLQTVLAHNDIVAIVFASRALLILADVMAAALASSGRAGHALRTEVKAPHDRPGLADLSE